MKKKGKKKKKKENLHLAPNSKDNQPKDCKERVDEPEAPLGHGGDHPDQRHNQAHTGNSHTEGPVGWDSRLVVLPPLDVVTPDNDGR